MYPPTVLLLEGQFRFLVQNLPLSRFFITLSCFFTAFLNTNLLLDLIIFSCFLSNLEECPAFRPKNLTFFRPLFASGRLVGMCIAFRLPNFPKNTTKFKCPPTVILENCGGGLWCMILYVHLTTPYLTIFVFFSKQDMLEILKDYGKTQINTKQVARVLGEDEIYHSHVSHSYTYISCSCIHGFFGTCFIIPFSVSYCLSTSLPPSLFLSLSFRHDGLHFD